ncbi:MAG: homoserine dehydrogenase [Anaerolineae bacterium]|nr:homoserine dehydrogenase [Anaerolineae bacterium]
MRRVNAVLSGLGNIGSRFIGVLDRKRDVLRDKYDLDVCLVAAADVEGGAVAPDGLDLARVAGLRGTSIGTLGRPGLTILDILREVDADIFFEATPVNLKTGEPGLSAIRAALGRGMHVVTTNKGPLALAYGELRALARASSVQLRHSGAVLGGLPTVNIGQRDLAGATILRVEAQVNLANSYILHQMARGMSYFDAVRSAQEQGCCDKDEALDVEGWDAVIKLVILANSVLGMDAHLDDVQREGIAHLRAEAVLDVRASGRVLKYVAEAAYQENGRYDLRCGLRALPPDHPLAALGPLQMGVVYTSDLYGTISAAIREEEPTPSASSMLRDLLTIYG